MTLLTCSPNAMLYSVANNITENYIYTLATLPYSRDASYNNIHVYTHDAVLWWCSFGSDFVADDALSSYHLSHIEPAGNLHCHQTVPCHLLHICVKKPARQCRVKEPGQRGREGERGEKYWRTRSSYLALTCTYCMWITDWGHGTRHTWNQWLPTILLLHVCQL